MWRSTGSKPIFNFCSFGNFIIVLKIKIVDGLETNTNNSSQIMRT